MNILGVDYGVKNIGLAWMQSGIDVVLPYGKIDASAGAEKALGELSKLIKEEKIDKIVIGLPLGTDGSENKNTEKIRGFADRLKNLVGDKIEFMNEAFTSQQADRMGGKASRDEKAAMIILETYKEKNIN